MKVVKINNLTTIFNNEKKPLIAIWGFFDGWHLGHQALLKQMLTVANENGYQTLVISFNVKPQSVLLNEKLPILLNDHDKEQFLIEQKIDYYCQLEFSHELAQNSAEEFISWLLDNNVKAVVVAKNIHFGHKGKGSLSTLQSSPLKVFISKDIFDKNNQKVSSTYIKELLVNTNIIHANKLLNNNGYVITGKVIDGIKEGRVLGFPTANLELTDNYLIPGIGIYITLTQVDNKWYQSMTVIIMRNGIPLVESYLLNFDQDIYGKIIKVKFLTYLRDNLVFTSKEELIKQINQDLQDTILYFQNNENAVN